MPNLIPSAAGAANDWYATPAYLGVNRLLIAVHLAMNGETDLLALRHLTGAPYASTWRTVRHMSDLHHLEWSRSVRPCKADLRPRNRHTQRVVSITPWGRRWLWRYGWVTRRLLYEPVMAVPLRTDVPDNPLAAVRQAVCPAFLRPSAMAVINEFALFPTHTFAGLVQAVGDPSLVVARLRAFHRAGYVRRIAPTEGLRWVLQGAVWELTPSGRRALARHVDAMRRVAGNSGHRPSNWEWLYPHNNSRALRRFYAQTGCSPLLRLPLEGCITGTENDE